jgi:hypothetical protein
LSALNGNVREHVVREVRTEIRGLAGAGLSAGEIGQRVNGHRNLSVAEQGLVELLTYHAVAEARGHY